MQEESCPCSSLILHNSHLQTKIAGLQPTSFRYRMISNKRQGVFIGITLTRGGSLIFYRNSVFIG